MATPVQAFQDSAGHLHKTKAGAVGSDLRGYCEKHLSDQEAFDEPDVTDLIDMLVDSPVRRKEFIQLLEQLK